MTFYVAVCLIEEKPDGTKTIKHERQVSAFSRTEREQGARAYIDRVVDKAFELHRTPHAQGNK